MRILQGRLVLDGDQKPLLRLCDLSHLEQNDSQVVMSFGNSKSFDELLFRGIETALHGERNGQNRTHTVVVRFKIQGLKQYLDGQTGFTILVMCVCL